MNDFSSGKNSFWPSWQHRLMGLFTPGLLLRKKYSLFRDILRLDGQALDLLADLESHLFGQNPADHWRVCSLCDQVIELVSSMTVQLQAMNPHAYRQLSGQLRRLSAEIRAKTVPAENNSMPPYILSLDLAADSPDLAGGKAANLSAAARAGVIIPRGFVITANAFHRFIRDNRLENELIRRFQLVHADDHETIIRITGELQELILGAEVPGDIASRIELAAESLKPAPFLAVRSSALAEDGQISFAGQYASELEVPVEDVVAAYKRVIAGKYCPRAISYRIHHGLSDAETAMAALVVPMIDAQTSGVVYTLDPSPGKRDDSLGIYAVKGLAEGLVDGSSTPEKYHLDRKTTITAEQIPVTQNNVLLSVSELLQLREWGLKLEAHFGCPQDVEWALDAQGLTILQSRNLHQKKDPPPVIVQDRDLHAVLYRDLHCASAGISCGPVFSAPTGKAFRNIPPGSIVFTTTLRPALAQFLDRVVGVIASSGSRASHFASVARERGIPVLVGSGIELSAGQVVTLDAAAGRIFKGCVNTVLQTGQRNPNKEFPTKKYAPLVGCMTHLSLIDPDGESFTPERCCSMHDMVRFCHEKSVREMFRLVGRNGRGLGRAKKLVTDLPLVMYVLDLDGGMSANTGMEISLAEVSSLPLQACWRGMSDSRISWDAGQNYIDWEGFDRVSAGIFSFDSQLLASYAVVSREYLHLNIRFGYHFSILDSICGEQTGANYINFRFKGGGAAYQQMLFRLQFITHVLTSFGFETSIRGDMLDATFSRVPAAEIELALTRLGMLLAATRLMDVRLTSTRQANDEAERFILLASRER